MLIRLANSVLANATWHPLLDVVAGIVEREGNPHSFDPLEHTKLRSSAWLVGASGIRALIAATLAASAKSVSQQGIQNLVIVQIDANATVAGETTGNVLRVHPYGALFLLTQPLNVIVEDETSDGGFILWAARALGFDAIIRAYRDGVLSFRHAGGKGQLVKSASALSNGVWPRSDKPIRSMVLRAAAVLDSDAKHPTDSPNDSIRDDVTPLVAFVHVLAKRSIENYAPPTFLRALMEKNERSRVDAFMRMSGSQRAHFPLKRGFRSEDGTPQTLAQFANAPDRTTLEKTLYVGTPPEVWNAVSPGFGTGVSAIFTETQYRCEPNSTGLFDHDDTQELRGLMQRILDHL